MRNSESFSRSDRFLRILLLAIGYAATAHFVIGIAFTLRLALALGDQRLHLFRFSLPYLGILVVLLSSVVLAHVRRLRWSIRTLMFGLMVSVCACVYDFAKGRYQIGGGGIGHTYTIWWWYYEPYWHGYEPGNV